MAIKGSLKEASLADVCQLLALGLKTGCLSITDKSRFGQIYFNKGRITYARVINRRDRIGDLLLRDALITQEQLAAALEVQYTEPDRRLGETLVGLGFITEENLQLYIRIQIEEAIYHLFTWARGNFFFEADQEPDADILVSINPDSLLLEAARRVDEWSLIAKKIPSLDMVFEVEIERLRRSDLNVSAEQERIAAMFDGTRSVQDMVDETGMGEFDIGKTLYGLIQAGYAHPIERAADTEARRTRAAELLERHNLGIAFYRAGMLDDATREYGRVLELEPSNLNARFHLALVMVRAERYRDAVSQFKKLLEEQGPHFGAFINLAYALRRLGRPTDALLVLNEADQLRPRTAVVALARGVAQLEASNLDAAIESFGQYRELQVGAGRVPAFFYYYCALAYAIRGDLQTADATITEGLGEHGAAAPLLLLAGAIAERRGEFTLAERYYRQVVEEDSTIVHAHKNLGDVAYRRTAHQEASEHYQRAIALDPDFGDDVYAKLGNIHYKRRERFDAMKYWTRSLELNPDNQVVRNNLEIVQSAAG